MKDLKEIHINREISIKDVGKTEEVWMGEIQRLAENTQRSYRNGVRQFLEHLGTDYDGLYEMKLADMRSGDTRDLRRVERLLSQYMFKLAKGGLAPNTAKRVGIAVTHFMRTQGLTFSLMRNEWPRGESVGQRIVLRDQIKQMYENASAWMRARNRALQMFAKDSGLRLSDIEQLDVDDYLDARSVAAEGEIFKELKPLTTKKTGAIAFVCIGPEAVAVLDLYLEERGARRGEPLFLDHNGQRLKVTAMSELFRRFSDVLEDGGRISAHSFRKFNETMMEAAGIPLNWIKRYQGRRVTDSTGPYSNPQDVPDKLIKTYIEGYHQLRVFTEKQELEAVKQELTEYKSKAYTRDREFAEMRKTVQELIKYVELQKAREEKSAV